MYTSNIIGGYERCDATVPGADGVHPLPAREGRLPVRALLDGDADVPHGPLPAVALQRHHYRRYHPRKR